MNTESPSSKKKTTKRGSSQQPNRSTTDSNRSSVERATSLISDVSSVNEEDEAH